YGAEAAAHTPPVRKMLEAGLPVGAGTDATRVASYNPFVSLYWLISGRTVGGTPMYAQRDRLERMEALRRYTVGSAWFSNDETRKGALVPGQFADFAVLSDDFFTIEEASIKHLTSVLTVVGGRIVYAAAEFDALSPPALPVSPSWSPVAEFGSYARFKPATALHAAVPAQSCSDACVILCGIHQHAHGRAWSSNAPVSDQNGFWGALGCSCFAF
ncbi:amidohydrolase family protein, partial [Paraburkholderia sp. BR10879]